MRWLGALGALSFFAGVGPAAADPLVDHGRICIDADQLRGYQSVSRPSDRFEFLGDPGGENTMALARRARDFAARDRIFERWRAILGTGPLPSLNDAGRPGPLRLYFTGERFREEIGVSGLHGPYCEGNRRRTDVGLILISDRAANHPEFGDQLRAAVAHEIFHAFQSGVNGAYNGGSWWHEAVAEWAELGLTEDPAIVAALDASVFGHPELPLDTTGPPAGPTAPAEARAARRHPYGLFRFVQTIEAVYLSAGTGDRDFHRFLRRSFNFGSEVRTASIETVDDAHPGRLGSAVAHFWTSRLFPLVMRDDWVSGPVTTPGSRMLTTTAPLHGAPCCSEAGFPSITVQLNAPRHAVDTARIPLAPETSFVAWSISALSRRSYIGVSSGPEDENDFDGDGATSRVHDRPGGVDPIVGDALGGTGCVAAREVRTVLVNGTDRPASGSITFYGVSNEPCAGG